MDSHQAAKITAVIAYIEAHLNEPLDLDAAARAAGYSKYHLHRMFTGTVGMPLHRYIQRRKLTEAARRLVYAEHPVLELALDSGYESQQAFTTAFKALYKRTPAEYRQHKVFYPLQLAFTLHTHPPDPNTARISYAVPADCPDWMEFLALVIDGFPCLDRASHLEQVQRHIQERQALVMRAGPVLIGAAACSPPAGSIDFLAVHPQYRQSGAEQALLDAMLRGPLAGREVSITTFRAGDKADTGQRETYKRLGFAEAESLVEFGYPTQRLVLSPKQEGGGHG